MPQLNLQDLNNVLAWMKVAQAPMNVDQAKILADLHAKIATVIAESIASAAPPPIPSVESGSSQSPAT